MSDALGCDKKISVILNTARADSAFPQAGDLSVLEHLARELAQQEFNPVDFELIAVDGLYAARARRFALVAGAAAFRILHISPKQSAMVRGGRPAICAYKNTGIAHARGELLLTVDDGCKLDPLFLDRIWRAWQKRLCLSALAEAVDDQGNWCVGKGHQDSRRIYLDETGKCIGPKGGNILCPPGQGFQAFPLQAALELNGYDEMFDGSRGLEDTDFGARLQKAGYHIALDAEHRVGLYALGGWSSDAVAHHEEIHNGAYTQGVIKCSQTTFRIRNANVVRANAVPWSDLEWSYVTPRCRHLAGTSCSLFGPQHPCPYVGLCSDKEHPGLKELRAAPEVFDLAAVRLETLRMLKMSELGFSSTPPGAP